MNKNFYAFKKIIFVLLVCASTGQVNPATILHILNNSDQQVTLKIVENNKSKQELLTIQANDVKKDANIKIPLADCLFESISKTSECLSITTKLGTFFCIEGGYKNLKNKFYATWLQKIKSSFLRQLAPSYGLSGLAGSDSNRNTNLQLILKINEKGTIEADNAN